MVFGWILAAAIADLQCIWACWMVAGCVRSREAECYARFGCCWQPNLMLVYANVKRKRRDSEGREGSLKYSPEGKRGLPGQRHSPAFMKQKRCVLASRTLRQARRGQSEVSSKGSYGLRWPISRPHLVMMRARMRARRQRCFLTVVRTSTHHTSKSLSFVYMQARSFSRQAPSMLRMHDLIRFFLGHTRRASQPKGLPRACSHGKRHRSCSSIRSHRFGNQGSGLGSFCSPDCCCMFG